jgi:hypothetical protein
MKKIATFLLALAFVLPVSAKAATVAELQVQIANLLAQIQQLQAQLAQQTGSATSAWCHTFGTDIGVGSSGNEVYSLSLALQKEGINLGKFDSFDETAASAVSAFQQKYKSEILTPAGLSSPTGYLGARTRAKLNSLYGCSNTNINLPNPAPTPTPVACTADAKLCPDGKTYVSRTAPSCQFAACPTSINKSPSSPAISGQTSVIAGSSNLYKAVSTDPDNDNITYTFDWGDGTGQDVKTFGSEYDYSVYHNWSSSGIYQITVYASDGKGGQSVGTLSVKVSVPASITVTDPAGAKGGQDIEPGNNYTIRWQTSGNFNNGVNLHLCSLSGSCHALGGNSQGVSAAPGFGSYSYSWYVDPNEPFFPGSNFRIKVTDASNSSVYGYSGYFDVGIVAPQPSIHISAITTGQTSDVYANADKGTPFAISGVPMNLNLAGNDFTRAFFGSLAANNCWNNSATENTWTMTCTANITGPADYYVEIYKNGQTYRSNTVTVNVNP